MSAPQARSIESCPSGRIGEESVDNFPNTGDPKVVPLLEKRIAALESLDLEGLRSLWKERYGPPPRLRSVELLRLSLAWRLQADALGGMDPDTRRTLKRNGALEAEGKDLGIGARLRREWQGRIVEVIVEADGFRWEDSLYPSLSAAATAITGTRWNGPRFFGLRKEKG
jgi:hypothetical protein